MADFTVYAWIGWATATVILIPAWFLTGLLGKSVYDRLRRVYHLTVIGYWLDRLEQGGVRVFQKAEQEDAAHQPAKEPSK